MNRDSILASDVHVYHGGDQARRGWLAVLLAALLTLGMFALLPYADQLSTPVDPQLDVRSVTVTPQAEPPEPRVYTPPAPPAPADPKVRVPPPISPPELAPPAPAPLPTTLSLDLDLQLAPPELASAVQFPLQPAPPAPTPPPATVAPTPPAPTTASEPAAAAVPARPAGTLQAHEVDQLPRATRKVAPVYPSRARWRNEEGYVDLQFTVDAEGQVGRIEVVESTPRTLFDQAAIEALSKWQFEPGLKNGFKVATRLQLRIRFELD